jgi:hypothetical protein
MESSPKNTISLKYDLFVFIYISILLENKRDHFHDEFLH